MGGDFLLQATIYMGAAIICVPLAKKLGMGSVLGYLMAGVLVGPFLLGFIGEEGSDIMHFAEFGVVMMLFLVGLELDPSRLWSLRKLILGTGLSQVAGTTLLVFLAALALGMHWQGALAIGMSLAMSSTAIVLQSMKEKDQLKTEAGQNSFAILLFQDIAVIPILAVLPLLAVQSAGSSDGHHSLFESLPGWLYTLALLGTITSVVIIGRFLVPPLLRLVAKTRIRELFTASALLIVVGIAFLMTMAGLSPALGTFLAGVILANSSFRHELESDLEPFKGLLLGLFFMAVGASINFGLIGENPVTVLSLSVGIIVLKTIIILIIGKFFRMSVDQNLIMAVSLAQVGEFAFVTLSFISQLSILTPDQVGLMMAVTAISMAMTPVMILVLEKLILPRLGTKINEDKPADEIDEKQRVIIAGFSHFGSTLGRFLRANGVNATILDHDSDRVELLRKMGFKVFYGDATRADLLESAGAAEAHILVSAIDSPETNLQLVETARKHFPHLRLMIRARNRFDAYELMNIDVMNPYREHLDTSVRMGVDVLKELGYRSYTLHRAAQQFIRYDEEAMHDLYQLRHDRNLYISASRKQIEMQEELLNNDFRQRPDLNDHAWDSGEMKKSTGGTEK
ncbi:MAG: monovalent cation:H+ antiporter-2 CPA2 family [Bacteroidetes bacterium]|nr:MAG: monovalent cation:H+ antiporter-2 CPA2 family [Bacteroidota bacterium]